MSLRVIRSWRDDGPTLSPDWRMWAGAVEDRTVYETWDHAKPYMAALRRRLEAAGLHVRDVVGEPCCDHDLSHYEDPSDHYSYGDCDQTFLVAYVKVPGRDHQHAYQQTCEAVGVVPHQDGAKVRTVPPMPSIRIADGGAA